MNRFFIEREVCPACASMCSVTLCRHEYTAPPIREYLAWYYAPVGPGVELEYLEGTHYTLKECADCGLIYQSEIPGDALMARLYERWLDPQTVRAMERKERNAEYYLWSATQIARGLEMLNRVPSEVRFLDFGMGWGHWCLLAKGFGCDAYGMELSDTRREHATRSGIVVLSRNELAHHRFDFINAEQVFEHLADPLDTLKAFAAALEPDGVVRIAIPTGWDIKRRLKVADWSLPDSAPDSLNAVAPMQHINCYSDRSLVTMAEKAGLTPASVQDAPFPAGRPSEAFKLMLLSAYRRLFPALADARRERRRQRQRETESTIYLKRALQLAIGLVLEINEVAFGSLETLAIVV